MSWIATAVIGSAVIGGGASMYSANKMSKAAGNVQGQPQMTDYQMTGGDYLQKLLEENPNLPKFGEAYTGKLSAGITPQEQTSLDMLTKYLGSPGTGDLFGASKAQIMDTLAGKYSDPNTSPYVQAMKVQSKTNLDDLINQINARRGGRGNFYTTQALAEQGDTQRRVAENLDAIIGNFMNTERGRQLEAAPIAANLDEYINQTVPLKAITAGQQLGSLSRTLEQGDLERQYQEFKRQREEQMLPVKAAQSLYGQNVEMGLNSLNAPATNTSIDTISKIAGMVSPDLLQKLFQGGGANTGAYVSPIGSYGGTSSYFPSSMYATSGNWVNNAMANNVGTYTGPSYLLA